MELQLIKHKNIVNYIKAQRLCWFGHVQRMPDTRTVKKIFKWNPLTKRSQGRPKYRWEDNVTFVIWTSLSPMAPKVSKISKQAAADVTRHITFTIPETLETVRKHGSATSKSVI